MTEFLGADWLARARDIAATRDVRCDPPLTLQVVVTGGGSGEARWYLVVDDDGVRELSAGTADVADVVLTVTAPDAAAVLVGELDPSVGFMQGRIKTAGDPGRLLEVLSACASGVFAAARAELAAETQFQA